MSIRDDLLANVTLALDSTSVGVSSELPWLSGDVELHNKNLKTVYFDAEQLIIEELFLTLDHCDVYDDVETITAYLTVDAKNTPADINTVISAMHTARLAITGRRYNLCNVTTEIVEDRITYSFEYEFRKVHG